MASEKSLSFANFVCRFGDNKVLLDYYNEIVEPAFLDENLSRKYGQSSYVILDAKRVILDRAKNVVALTGRLVKDTILTREQILRGKRLIPDNQRMQSSPSAYFVLILNNHKLLYYPETTFAPDISAFGATIRAFLARKHNDYINRLYASQRQQGERVTKSDLRKMHPAPTVEVIPLPSEGNIKGFLSRYQALQFVTIKLVTPNDEFDPEETYRGLLERKLSLGAKDTTITHHNKNGLDTNAAAKEIDGATGTGNALVQLRGIDTEGNKLRADNESFQLKVHVDLSDLADNQRPKKLYNIFLDYVASGVIKIGSASANVASLLKTLI